VRSDFGTPVEPIGPIPGLRWSPSDSPHRRLQKPETPALQWEAARATTFMRSFACRKISPWPRLLESRGAAIECGPWR
jgi:hypothetical protein